MNRTTPRPLVAILLAASIGGGCRATSPTASGATRRPSWHERIEPTPTSRPTTTTAADDADPPVERDYADGASTRPLGPDVAFRVLLNTDEFAGAHVGYSGGCSVQVEAFRLILARADAADTFDDLARRGRPAGRLFGLCGLFLVAPSRYAAAEPLLAASAEPVAYVRGCVVESVPAGEIVRSPYAYMNRERPRPEGGIEAYQERVRRTGRTGELPDDDIAGGRIPESFRPGR